MSRLLFVLDIGFDRGGPSVHLLQDILRAALSAGNSVDVILKDTGGTDKVMPDEFANNKLLNYYAIKEKEEKRYGFVRRYLNEIFYAKKCSRIFLSGRQYDAAFLQSNTTAFFYLRLLKKLKCKLVYNVQDIFPYNLFYSKQLPYATITFPLFRHLQHLGYNLADKIITISDDMKQTLIDDGVESHKIDVVFNWSYTDAIIHLENIKPENIAKLNFDSKKCNVVYAGNIGIMQNVELIASAARKMKECQSIHFYIIGEGASRKKIELMTSDLPNVTMLPMFPSVFAESIYAQADINIIPLSRGGIKTALPSKTATILRTLEPIVFCVESDSLFSKMISNDQGIWTVSNTDENELIEVLYSVSKTNCKCNHNEMLINFSKNNSLKYVECMTRRI